MAETNTILYSNYPPTKKNKFLKIIEHDNWDNMRIPSQILFLHNGVRWGQDLNPDNPTPETKRSITTFSTIYQWWPLQISPP